MDTKTLDIVLGEKYWSGELSIKEVARSFHAHGWTNFVDTDYAKRKMLEYFNQHPDEIAVLLKTGEELEPKCVHPKNGEKFTLEELQTFVGGYIQILYINNGWLMVVNEEGKLHGLPINRTATLLYNQYLVFGSDFICGDVLICRPQLID